LDESKVVIIAHIHNAPTIYVRDLKMIADDSSILKKHLQSNAELIPLDKNCSPEGKICAIKLESISRVKILTKKNGQCDVYFLDYGIDAKVGLNKLFKLSPEVSNLKPQCFPILLHRNDQNKFSPQELYCKLKFYCEQNTRLTMCNIIADEEENLHCDLLLDGKNIQELFAAEMSSRNLGATQDCAPNVQQTDGRMTWDNPNSSYISKLVNPTEIVEVQTDEVASLSKCDEILSANKPCNLPPVTPCPAPLAASAGYLNTGHPNTGIRKKVCL